MSKQLTTIELSTEKMRFSSGHFTIFSATERERLHGHNYTVTVALTYCVGEMGYFDYRFYENKAQQLCQKLDLVFLLATQSPCLTIKEDKIHYHITFNQQTMSLLKQDVKLLPVRNISFEELSRWFLEQLLADKTPLIQHGIEKIIVKVGSGAIKSGSAIWEKYGKGLLQAEN